MKSSTNDTPSHIDTVYKYIRDDKHNKLEEQIDAGNVGLNDCDTGGMSLVYYASYYGSVNSVTLLAEKKANLDLSNASLETPLHKASEMGNTDMVMALVDLKADVTLRTNNNETPYSLAMKGGNYDVAGILRKEVNKAAIRKSDELNGTTSEYTPFDPPIFNTLKGFQKTGYSRLKIRANAGDLRSFSSLLNYNSGNFLKRVDVKQRFQENGELDEYERLLTAANLKRQAKKKNDDARRDRDILAKVPTKKAKKISDSDEENKSLAETATPSNVIQNDPLVFQGSMLESFSRSPHL